MKSRSKRCGAQSSPAARDAQAVEILWITREFVVDPLWKGNFFWQFARKKMQPARLCVNLRGSLRLNDSRRYLQSVTL